MTMGGAEFAIRAAGLGKRFGKLEAVCGLDLRVRSGEIYGLVGPDGAGKTTTLRMLASVMDPDAGSARVAGFDTVHDSRRVKDRIAYMSQRFGLYPDLTVQENIELYADLYGEPRKGRAKRIDDLLDFSFMRPFKKRRAGRLSGGMKQKLQLVCALVHTPQVLLLDEPTNGVDPVSRRDFWKILYSLLKQDVAILVTTAYLDEAERCTRVGLLDHGRLLAQGRPDELRELLPGGILRVVGYSSQEMRRARDLLRGTQFGTGESSGQSELDVQIGSVALFGTNLHVSCSDPETDREKIARFLSHKHIGVVSLQVEPPSLEDIFISEVGRQRDALSEVEAEMSPDGEQEFPRDEQPVPAGRRGGESLNNIAVRVEHLTRWFGSFVAVNDISLEVPRGEIFGFLGPNGAGKSTTIRMLCGLLPPSSGMGVVAGYDVREDPEAVKQRIGYMSQKFSLYEDLSVRENIEFYGGVYGLSGRRLAERRQWAVRLSGLQGREMDMAGTLSGGWKQKLAIACSVLHEPPILFLDEPTSGVDPLARRTFWDLIHDMSKRGVSVFVTTHYMEEAEYCDRVALIYKGGMIALGSPAQLKAERMHETIVDIACHKPQDMLDAVSDLSSVREAALFGAGLHAVCADADAAERDIRELFRTRGIELERVRRITPSMEDVFVSLIEEADRKAAQSVVTTGATGGKAG